MGRQLTPKAILFNCGYENMDRCTSLKGHILYYDVFSYALIMRLTRRTANLLPISASDGEKLSPIKSGSMRLTD